LAPPFIDEHVIAVAAPRERVWAGLLRYADRNLLSGNEVLHQLLGTDPPAGFAISEKVPLELLELAGRHRFSHYGLAFELRDAGPGRTRIAARSFAEFPGLHGRIYRALVIGSRLHVVATRGMLSAIRRSVLDDWKVSGGDRPDRA
jgi:hypothetical protein